MGLRWFVGDESIGVVEFCRCQKIDVKYLTIRRIPFPSVLSEEILFRNLQR